MTAFLKPAAESLALTVAVEIIIVLIFGLRSKAGIWTIILINLITNPAMNFLIFLNKNFWFKNEFLLVTICLEAIVILVEWRLLAYTLRLKNVKSLVMSLGMNAASYVAGVFLFGAILHTGFLVPR